jgi:hypothetical protein
MKLVNLWEEKQEFAKKGVELYDKVMTKNCVDKKTEKSQLVFSTLLSLLNICLVWIKMGQTTLS